MPALIEHLFETYAKQDRLGSSDGQRSKLAESPMPVRFNDRDHSVRRVIDSLSNTMTTWARVLADHHGWDVPEPPRRSAHNGKRGVVVPVSTPAVDLACYAAEWLAEHVGYLRTHPAAMEAHTQLTDAIAAAEMAIDRPPVTAFRGPCRKCGRDLDATPQAAIVVCRGCGEQHDGAQLRDRLLSAVADHLVTTVELSAALSGLSDTPVPIGTIRSWRSRGQLAPHAWLHDDRAVVARPLDATNKPLFRVGDAVQLLGELSRLAKR